MLNVIRHCNFWLQTQLDIVTFWQILTNISTKNGVLKGQFSFDSTITLLGNFYCF